MTTWVSRTRLVIVPVFLFCLVSVPCSAQDARQDVICSNLGSLFEQVETRQLELGTALRGSRQTTSKAVRGILRRAYAGQALELTDEDQHQIVALHEVMKVRLSSLVRVVSTIRELNPTEEEIAECGIETGGLSEAERLIAAAEKVAEVLASSDVSLEAVMKTFVETKLESAELGALLAPPEGMEFGVERWTVEPTTDKAAADWRAKYGGL